MTYLAAYLLTSLIGCAVWFLISPFTEDDDVHETNPEVYAGSFRPIHGRRALSDGGEENDAAIGRVAATIVGSE